MKKLLFLLLVSCSASQHPARTWDRDVQAALVVAAHAVDALDATAASEYTAAAHDAGDIRALDAQLAGRITARNEAARALVDAQSAVVQMVRDPSTQCAALTAVHFAGGRLARIPELASSTSALAALESLGPHCEGAR